MLVLLSWLWWWKNAGRLFLFAKAIVTPLTKNPKSFSRQTCAAKFAVDSNVAVGKLLPLVVARSIASLHVQ